MRFVAHSEYSEYRYLIIPAGFVTSAYVRLLVTANNSYGIETKFSRANAAREIFIFLVQLTTSRIGDLTRLIHTLAICVTIHAYFTLAVVAIYSGSLFRFRMKKKSCKKKLAHLTRSLDQKHVLKEKSGRIVAGGKTIAVLYIWLRSTFFLLNLSRMLESKDFPGNDYDEDSV